MAQVVIRSVHERTESLCTKLLNEVFHKKNITVIHEYPFSKALRKSFEIGIDSEKEWLLCIDADVLISKEGISTLLEKTRDVHENLFGFQGTVIDKFFAGSRGAGNHLYRSALLPKAIEQLSPEEVIRPENYVISRMQNLGFIYEQINITVGLHDFQQYYKDIYRKFIIHANKHTRYLDTFMPYWEKLSKTDMDFEVALLGLEDAQKISSKVTTDARLFPLKAESTHIGNKITEKSALSYSSNSMQLIENFINNFLPPREYYRFLDLASTTSINIPNKLPRRIEEGKTNIKRLYKKQLQLDI